MTSPGRKETDKCKQSVFLHGIQRFRQDRLRVALQKAREVDAARPPVHLPLFHSDVSVPSGLIVGFHVLNRGHGEARTYAPVNSQIYVDNTRSTTWNTAKTCIET